MDEMENTAESLGEKQTPTGNLWELYQKGGLKLVIPLETFRNPRGISLERQGNLSVFLRIFRCSLDDSVISHEFYVGPGGSFFHIHLFHHSLH